MTIQIKEPEIKPITDPMEALRKLAEIVFEMGREAQFDEPNDHKRDGFHAKTVAVCDLLDRIGWPERE